MHSLLLHRIKHYNNQAQYEVAYGPFLLAISEDHSEEYVIEYGGEHILFKARRLGR